MAEAVWISEEKENPLYFTIEEAEMFCELSADTEKARADQRIAAKGLAEHFLKKGDVKKYNKYLALSRGEVYQPAPSFEINYIEISNWYTNPRLVLSNLNKLLSTLGRAFLPSWFPVLGLSYALQTIMAAENNNKKLQFYWGIWFLLNLFGCVALFATMMSAGTGIAWAAIGVSIYSYCFDVQWESYLYYQDVQKQTAFLNKLTTHYPNDQGLIQSFNKKIASQNWKHREAVLLTCIILAGGILWGLSALFPPAFATIGAGLALGAYSYMLAKKVYYSWTNDNGFLKDYVRLGVPKLYNKLKNWLRPTPTPAPQKIMTLTHPEQLSSQAMISQDMKKKNNTKPLILVRQSSISITVSDTKKEPSVIEESVNEVRSPLSDPLSPPATTTGSPTTHSIFRPCGVEAFEEDNSMIPKQTQTAITVEA